MHNVTKSTEQSLEGHLSRSTSVLRNPTVRKTPHWTQFNVTLPFTLLAIRGLFTRRVTTGECSREQILTVLTVKCYEFSTDLSLAVLNTPLSASFLNPQNASPYTKHLQFVEIICTLFEQNSLYQSAILM
jgi:hypothetical protein